MAEHVAVQSEEDGPFLKLKGTVIDARVVEYKGSELHESLDPDRTYKLNRSKEALSDDQFLASLAEAPLFYGDHVDASVKSARKCFGGYPVGVPQWETPTSIRQD